MIELTDQQWGFVELALSKVDPTGIVTEAAEIRAKIREYAISKQQQQMVQATREPVE